jgi:hypothetical protein
MRHDMSTFVLIVSLLCVTVRADEPSPGESEFDEFMTYYYLEKESAQVVKNLKWLQVSKMLDQHESAVEPTSAFFAVVFEQNPSRVKRYVKCTKFTGKAKDAIESALWLSGNEKLIEDVFGEIPDYAATKCEGLKKWAMNDPGDLDMMWGAFLASGDGVYVKKIIDVLDKKQPLTGDERLDLVTRKAAEWSLESNMRRHELVYRVLGQEAKSRKGAVKKRLEKMIDSAKMWRGLLPEKDGDFSAMPVVMDEESLKEFKKPSDEPLKIKKTKTAAKRGDVVAVKIVFAGIALTEDLRADVDYDIKIVDPNGEFNEEADLKEMKALSRKVATRFLIFDNQEVVMIRFKTTDPPGTYEITATIRDKVGGKSIPLKAQITVDDN